MGVFFFWVSLLFIFNSIWIYLYDLEGGGVFGYIKMIGESYFLYIFINWDNLILYGLNIVSVWYYINRGIGDRYRL